MSEPSTANGPLARRFEAIAFDWDGTAVPDRSTDARAVREVVEAACAAGIEVAVVSATNVQNIDRQLQARPRGPGELHLLLNRGSEVFRVDAAGPALRARRGASDREELEVRLTDKADSARWYFAHLWQRGIHAQQCLIMGDELGTPGELPAGVIALGGGPQRFLAIMHAQLELRAAGALPIVAYDSCWTLRVAGVERVSERARESLLALADGRLGTRGSALTEADFARPAVLMAGVYRGPGSRSQLVRLPLWNRIARAGGRHEPVTVVRTLDLHGGLLAHEQGDGLQALALSALSAPATTALFALGERGRLRRARPLSARAARVRDEGDGVSTARVPFEGGVVEAAGVQRVSERGQGAALERFAAYVAMRGADRGQPARRIARRAQARGKERLLVEHRRAWAERWHRADVRIDGDAELQLAVRVALYHLMSSVGSDGEAAVGARGLTGMGYRGHVFWDSDVFVLPFMAATHPAGARAILEYRLRRLPAARAAARRAGFGGARFAWESAGGGEDVTPRQLRNPARREVRVYTGQREEHIVADVAWAAACYADWTGDEAFRRGPGRTLIIETARYWASRIESDEPRAGARAHIRGVIGPDEYHEDVDDNAYTNVMARWNLRRAWAETADAAADGTGGAVGRKRGGAVAAIEPDEPERSRWLALADALVDGWTPQRGMYEQFAGFWELEPIVIAQLAPRRPVAAELLLPPERLQRAQVVKQADVLMAHHLVPSELVPGSLAADLAFYEPRTSHASSLSPGVHAALLARAGRLAEARAALVLAARIDLEDLSGPDATGVHLAAMGSVWQALAYGFLGARPSGEVLALDPCLAPGWESLELRLRFRGSALRVRVSTEEVEVCAERPVKVALAGAEPVLVDAGGYRAAHPSGRRPGRAAASARRQPAP